MSKGSFLRYGPLDPKKYNLWEELSHTQEWQQQILITEARIKVMFWNLILFF